ncbi:hypothetical protein D3874_04550 [Oleomonas cavernae]|uniref:Uncharacterized protein n=1 Tax=Oleomonas cavernae TaxID=2320859 RepID=A0A418W8P3_9PROT|nr:hypothetical protein [Oleomonas cavernae]RJF86385.1 hypothetical protein D3874_04550 [Oleomonas cavernae]
MTASVSLATTRPPFPLRAFVLTCLVVSIWVNASEIFRYFAFVMPMTRETLAMVPGVAPMDLTVFLAWGLWDTLLVAMTVAIYWLAAERFGEGWGIVVLAGTLSWLFFFALFWLAMLNMNLADTSTLAIALPWAWLELVVASAIARPCLWKFVQSNG